MLYCDFLQMGRNIFVTFSAYEFDAAADLAYKG
ncbi:Hypothetical protein Y17_1203 [Pectobacterium wasabiae CFBP 3304]|nr:Hypothetical protein Y17_1203 [Pectobacterium wasabiae CFBP 3304]